MDGLFHGKPYEQMDDLGVPLFLETPKYHSVSLACLFFSGISHQGSKGMEVRFPRFETPSLQTVPFRLI